MQHLNMTAPRTGWRYIYGKEFHYFEAGEAICKGLGSLFDSGYSRELPKGAPACDECVQLHAILTEAVYES